MLRHALLLIVRDGRGGSKGAYTVVLCYAEIGTGKVQTQINESHASETRSWGGSNDQEQVNRETNQTDNDGTS